MKKKTVLIFGSAVCALVLVGAGIFYYFHAPASDITFQDFNYERDAKEVLEVINKDRYWLFGNPDYSAEFMLKYRARQQDIMTAGQLNIKVARDAKGHYLGFTAFYMKPGNLGHILFVDVNPLYRRQGNAEKFVHYAMSELKAQGAVAVQLLTRSDNERARRLYTRLGFKLVDSIEGYEPQEGFVYFDYPL